VWSLHYAMQLNQSAAAYLDKCRLSVSSFSALPPNWKPETGNHNVDILIEARQVTCHSMSSLVSEKKGGLHIYNWRQTAKGKLDCNC